jgi:hypothetical protein
MTRSYMFVVSAVYTTSRVITGIFSGKDADKLAKQWASFSPDSRVTRVWSPKAKRSLHTGMKLPRCYAQ